MDIGSGKRYPCNSLSNFSPHPFVIDEVQCNSMEGFLQSLKFKDPPMQEYVCTLVGKQAKFKGKNKKWWKTQTLWWKGKEFGRQSIRYTLLINRAYDELANNASFRKALLASGDAVFTHSIGKNDASRTVLTERDFCYILTRLRKKIKSQESKK